MTVFGLGCLFIPQIVWIRDHGSVDGPGNRFERTCREVAQVLAEDGAPAFFVDITDEIGVDFRHVVGPVGTYFFPEINGAGGALFDYDSDGDLDLYLVNAGRSPQAVGSFPEGTRSENRMFRQEADHRFVDVTEESGLGDTGYGLGCTVGDIDNDGDLDVYLTNFGADQLYRNSGDGTFTNITKEAGIHNPEWATGAIFVDYDRDGWLDLFVVNYVSDPRYGHTVACIFGNDRPSYCGPQKFTPTVDVLYHNDGMRFDDSGGSNVHFTDVAAQAGLSDTRGAGFAVVSADFNRDGSPDFYVANDTYPNVLWVNDGNGRFRNEGILRGAAVDRAGAAMGSMGIALGDVDGNGAFDLLVTNFSHEPNTLYLDDGHGTFADATEESRTASISFAHTGWGVAMLDLDHDGDLDIPVVNGLANPCELIVPMDVQQRLVVLNEHLADQEGFWRDYADRNLLLVNDGAGRFVDGSQFGGDFTSGAGSGRALIYGDIDDDGDLDLVVTYCGGRARVFRNDIPKRGHWLQIRALDPRLRRDAYGAEVVVQAGSGKFHRIVSSTCSYLASNDLRIHVGLGEADRYDAIAVRWPDGFKEVFPAGVADRLVVLNRGEGSPAVENEP